MPAKAIAASLSISPTMQGWVRASRGPAAKSLVLVNSIPTPTIAANSDEVLVRVSYVALQWSSAGALEMLPQLPGMGPRIPEIEFSGVIAAAGSRAPAELREVGARVAGFRTVTAGILAGRGVLCEYVKSAPGQLTRLPDTMDLVAASGMAGCGSVALKMARTAAVQRGERVLLNGASSSIGSVLAQILKTKGAMVVGVASGRNEELARGLGVDEFIDYTAHECLPLHLSTTYSSQPFDWVFDCIGVHALYTGSPGYLKQSGAVMNVGAFEGFWSQARSWLVGSWLPTWLGGVPRRYIMLGAVADKDCTVYMVQLITDGVVRILIDSVWDMEDAVEAYERVTSNHARGKVIIKVSKDLPVLPDD